MGSHRKSSHGLSGQEKVVSLNTHDLRSRLNRLYKGMRSKGAAELGKFDYLWDLKELALLEGRHSVDIPEAWLDELERGLLEQEHRQGH